MPEVRQEEVAVGRGEIVLWKDRIQDGERSVGLVNSARRAESGVVGGEPTQLSVCRPPVGPSRSRPALCVVRADDKLSPAACLKPRDCLWLISVFVSSDSLPPLRIILVRITLWYTPVSCFCWGRSSSWPIVVNFIYIVDLIIGEYAIVKQLFCFIDDIVCWVVQTIYFI